MAARFALWQSGDLKRQLQHAHELLLFHLLSLGIGIGAHVSRSVWVESIRTFYHQRNARSCRRKAMNRGSAMQRATTETLYFETGPDNAVTMRVTPGEVFEVQTQLNRGPWLETHPDGVRLTKLLRGGNPASGCIWVEGAEPGMMLSVHVGQIDLDPVGFTRFRGQNGAMPAWFDSSGVGPQHRIVYIEKGIIHWDERRKLQVRPMIGFIGVAPE